MRDEDCVVALLLVEGEIAFRISNISRHMYIFWEIHQMRTTLLRLLQRSFQNTCVWEKEREREREMRGLTSDGGLDVGELSVDESIAQTRLSNATVANHHQLHTTITVTNAWRRGARHHKNYCSRLDGTCEDRECIQCVFLYVCMCAHVKCIDAIHLYIS